MTVSTEEDFNKSKAKLIAKVPKFALDVQPIYERLNLTWGGHWYSQIPTVENIEKTLLDLINKIEYGKDLHTGTGRLHVCYSHEECQVEMWFEYSESIFF